MNERVWTPAFLLAWASNFLHSTAIHAFLHLPGWIEAQGAGEVLIGALIATMSIAAISMRPFIGRLMDTRGRRLVAIAGGVLHCFVPLLYLLVDRLPDGSWSAIVGVRLVHGVAQAAIFSVLFTIAADLVPARRRAEGIALFGISGLIPIAIGGVLGDMVIVDGDYRNLFWITSGCSVLGLLCSLALPETRHGGPSRGFFVAARAPELRPIWFVIMMFALGIAPYLVFLKIYLLARPELGSMTTFYSTYAISAVLLRALFSWMPERYGLIRVLIPSMLTSAAGLLVLAFASEPTHLILAAALCGIGHGFAFPITSALVVTRAKPEERGSAVALYTALYDLGILLGGPTFGLAIKLADYPPTFALAASLVCVATGVFFVWDRRVTRG